MYGLDLGNLTCASPQMFKLLGSQGTRGIKLPKLFWMSIHLRFITSSAILFDLNTFSRTKAGTQADASSFTARRAIFVLMHNSKSLSSDDCDAISRIDAIMYSMNDLYSAGSNVVCMATRRTSHTCDLRQGLNALFHKTSSAIRLVTDVAGASIPPSRAARTPASQSMIRCGFGGSRTSFSTLPAFLVCAEDWSNSSTFICDKTDANSLQNAAFARWIRSNETLTPGKEQRSFPAHASTSLFGMLTSNISHTILSDSTRMMSPVFCFLISNRSIPVRIISTASKREM